MIAPGNIWSGSRTLAVLTNPTEMARRRGCLKHSYPIVYGGKPYEDVESAYKANCCGDNEARNELMTELIVIKFVTYPQILTWLSANGGIAFLRQCSHMTGNQRWDGVGEGSRFIACLMAAYIKALEIDP
jgi:hypothetical protein